MKTDLRYWHSAIEINALKKWSRETSFSYSALLERLNSMKRHNHPNFILFDEDTRLNILGAAITISLSRMVSLIQASEDLQKAYLKSKGESNGKQ